MHCAALTSRELHNGVIKQHGRLWISINTTLYTKLIAVLHTSALGEHSGAQQHTNGEDFVRQCEVCQHAKHELTYLVDKL